MLDWKAIAEAKVHPVQLHILKVLGRGKGKERSPNMLAMETGEPLGNVSYHMNALKKAGLVAVVRTAPRRGAVEHFYKVTKKARK